MEVDKQLKFKSHQRMQVEFISNNVDVMTHDFLSIVTALRLVHRNYIVIYTYEIQQIHVTFYWVSTYE